MSVNSSSTSNSSLDSVLVDCYDFTFSVFINTAFNATRTFLLLPLYILVLCLGHQRWRQQRSFATASHSDIFTYNMAALELTWCLGTVGFYCGRFAGLTGMITAGPWLRTFAYTGEAFFHILTCVERYLAVVHPVTYMGLRKVQGVRIRNISIGCVWLLCFGSSSAVTLLNRTLSITSSLILVAFTSVVVSFCSFCVLCVLIRPGPGEGGQDRKRVDQSKKKAFHTVMAITVVLWFWFGAFLVCYVLHALPLLSTSADCLMMSCTAWFNLPCSLVLPLLYLHRAGKLSCCCHKSR